MRKSTFFKVHTAEQSKKYLAQNSASASQDKRASSEFLPSTAYYKPLIVAFFVLAVGAFFYFQPAEKPFLTFVRVWCLFQAYAVVINLKEQLDFYEWWSQSTLSDAGKRGLGTNGYPLFGFIRMPILSNTTLRIVSVGFATGLVMCASLANQPFVGYFFLATTLLGLLYFSSLWAERNASYHREYLSVAILFYFCFTPEFYGFGQAWPAIVFLIKLHITSIYVAGAVQKIACSFMAKKSWFGGAPHGFLWRAMWAKPYFSRLQRFFFLHPKPMAVSAFFVLALEAFFFMHFWAGYDVKVAMMVCMIAFHVGVFLLQGIDYITFWNPAFLLWFIVPDTLDAGAWQLLQPWYVWPAAAFCGAQLLYAFTFIEDFNINIPPFTCCPMFVNVCRFNEPEMPYYCMWDMRSSIAFERLEWIYPFLRVEFGLGMDESDVKKMPFRFIGFGYQAYPSEVPALQSKWFHRDLLKETGFFLYANYEVDPELVARLARFTLWLHKQECATSIYDKQFLNEALQRYNACYASFAKDISRDLPNVQTQNASLEPRKLGVRIYGDIAVDAA